MEWQKLQGLMYGPRISEASLSPDVKTFFQLCRQKDATVYVVSHKTECANYDNTQSNLRHSAIRWMSENNFFDPDGLNLTKDDVTFVSTRREKIETIKRLGCSHFVDDLEEIFSDESFPTQVQKILFAPHHSGSGRPEVTVATSWKEVAKCIFPNPTSIPVLRS